jgi:hypothetical protein
MNTIRVEGRTYQVVKLPDADVHESNRPGYLLTGARGARYRTLRNQPRPHLLYLINARDWTRSAPKSWLTDKRGYLEVA